MINVAKLKVAVQMDPIEKINIAGDSSFAMMLEAQARGHALFYYTPDTMAMRDGVVSALVSAVEVRDIKGDDVVCLDVFQSRNDGLLQLADIFHVGTFR